MTAECCGMTGIGYCTYAINEPSSTRAHCQHSEAKVVMAERLDLEDLLRVQEIWMSLCLPAPSAALPW